MKLNLLRTSKYYYIRFKRLQGDPRSLALGCAAGIIIGISPTLPLHTVMIVSITLLCRISTLSALISATVFSNPLTFVLQYYLCWLTGNQLFPGRLTWERMQETLDIVMNTGFKEALKSVSVLSMDALLVMLSGGFIIGIPIAVISYFISIHFFKKIQRKRRKNLSF